MRRNDERGIVALAVVMLTVAMLMLLGLVVDGGRVIAARGRAAEQAQEAARAGAQELSPGVARGASGSAVEQGRAEAAARAYLAAAGAGGDVAVAGDQVTVTVTQTLATEILGLVGIRTFTVSQTQAARAEHAAVAAGSTP